MLPALLISGVCDNERSSPDKQVWALTETLQSDWALEMAKSLTVEMIKSTKATPGRGKQTPPSPVAKGISADAVGDEEASAGGSGVAFGGGNGSGAPDDGLGEAVDELVEEGGGDGEVRTAVVGVGRSSRGDEDDEAHNPASAE